MLCCSTTLNSIGAQRLWNGREPISTHGKFHNIGQIRARQRSAWLHDIPLPTDIFAAVDMQLQKIISSFMWIKVFRGFTCFSQLWSKFERHIVAIMFLIFPNFQAPVNSERAKWWKSFVSKSDISGVLDTKCKRIPAWNHKNDDSPQQERKRDTLTERDMHIITVETNLPMFVVFNLLIDLKLQCTGPGFFPPVLTSISLLAKRKFCCKASFT